MRFGSITQSNQFDGDQAYWRCMGCMTAKVCENAVEKYGDLASVPGFGELDAGKQAPEVNTAHEVPSCTYWSAPALPCPMAPGLRPLARRSKGCPRHGRGLPWHDRAPEARRTLAAL